MGTVKRSPQLANKAQRIAYGKVSKADLIEAYRDMFREFGGAGELDEVEWFADLEKRTALLRSYRKQWAKIDKEPG